MRIRGLAGFTLIEMMIVVTILGVLLSIGIPAFDDLIKNSRRTTVVNELISSLMTARAEAAKRGQAVTVCGLASSTDTSCTGGTNWDKGFIVFLDPDANGAIANVAADTLRKYTVDYSDIRIRTKVSAGAGHIVLQSFNQSGTGAAIMVCDRKRGNAKARRVCVGSNGRASASEIACSTVDPDDLSCPTT
jgi:type IV fimbrial biogenesis protein FimT